MNSFFTTVVYGAACVHQLVPRDTFHLAPVTGTVTLPTKAWTDGKKPTIFFVTVGLEPENSVTTRTLPLLYY